jgi:mannan endo-1,4-beta-mannosidase
VERVNVSCSATYRVVEQWPDGFKAEVTIKTADTPLTGWRLSWTFAHDQAISQWWNVAVATAGRAVTAQNSSENGVVAAHSSTTFAFLGTYRKANPHPSVTCAPG